MKQTEIDLAPSQTGARIRADGAGADTEASAEQAYTESIHHLTSGDTRQPVRAQLTYDGAPIPLDDAADTAENRVSRVQFRMWNPDGVVVDRRGSIDDDVAVTGAVRYEWQRGETDLDAGDYDAQFVVHYADGSQLSFPNTGAFVVTVHSAGPNP